MPSDDITTELDKCEIHYEAHKRSSGRVFRRIAI